MTDYRLNSVRAGALKILKIDDKLRSVARAGKLVLSLLVLLCLSLPQIAIAVTATELFHDGNRLFRDELYWAALLRYGQAADAGMDTPLLHYNSGVAHYRAKQYIRAREELLKANRYLPLQAVSDYNLGLVAYRSGDIDEALRRFRSARDQQQRRDISRLATKAIREIQKQSMLEEVTVAQTVALQKEKEVSNLDFRIRLGAGFDDNAYRTPGESYVDLSDPAQPTVDPVVQSGMFVPINLAAVYKVNSFEHEGFFGAYRFVGRFYADTALNQADEYLQELAFGSEYRRRSENRERRVYSAFKIAQHDETYYDPDTGVERSAGGQDISDRMSYLRYGPEFWIREKFGPLTVGAFAKGQLWDYKEVETVPEYDHEFWALGVHTQYSFTSTSLVRLTAEYYTRRFSDRPSFELDGSQPAGNPTVRYDYVEYGISARQRITRSMWLGAAYRLTDRQDRHVGYFDYSRDEYSVEFHMRLGNRFDFELRGNYRTYDYENAFAFHEPTAGRRTLESTEVGVAITYDMTENFDLVGDYLIREVTSSDSRIAYDRGMFLLGVRWAP